MKTIILFLFLLSASGLAISQEAQDPAEAIRELKEGVLVVRLRTQANKMARLEELMAKESPGNIMHKRLAYELEETRKDAAYENRLLVEAFRNNYRFSEVLFLPDSLAPMLKAQKQEGIFLNDSLQLDPGISLGGRSYLVAGMGNTDPSVSVLGSEALLMFDRSYDRMQAPFPQSSGMSGIRQWYKSFSLDDRELQEYFIHTIVSRMDRKLAKFYEEVSESEFTEF